MPSAPLPADPPPGSPDERRIPSEALFSDEEWLLITAAAHQAGCSVDEWLARVIADLADHPEQLHAYLAREEIGAEAAADLARRCAATDRNLQRLLKDHAAGEPPPSAAELATIAEEVVQLEHAIDRFFRFFFPAPGEPPPPPPA